MCDVFYSMYDLYSNAKVRISFIKSIKKIIVDSNKVFEIPLVDKGEKY